MCLPATHRRSIIRGFFLVKTPNQKKRIGPKIGVDFIPDEKLKKMKKKEQKNKKKKKKKKSPRDPIIGRYIVG